MILMMAGAMMMMKTMVRSFLVLEGCLSQQMEMNYFYHVPYNCLGSEQGVNVTVLEELFLVGFRG